MLKQIDTITHTADLASQLRNTAKDLLQNSVIFRSTHSRYKEKRQSSRHFEAQTFCKDCRSFGYTGPKKIYGRAPS